MKTQRMRLSVALAGVGIALGAVCIPARGDISQAVMFRNLQYAQTGDGNVLSFDSSFFTLRLLATQADEYTTVQAFYGGPGSPSPLAQVNATTYEYSPDFYTTRAEMDTNFPTGTYTLTANNINTSDADTTMFDYSADAYAHSLPYLTGTNYSDLQGMNPAEAFTFGFSPFVKDALATDPELFFTIFDAATNAPVFEFDFQPDTTTGVTLPANTLLANHAYGYDLDFSDRLTVTSNGADNDALLVFDVRTDGTFVTGEVPEPAAAMLLVMGVPALLVRRRSVEGGRFRGYSSR
jgi:hypothetical protein